MFAFNHKTKIGLFVVVLLALLTLGIARSNVARADAEASPIPKCSEPEFNGVSYFVRCKPGDGATMTFVYARKRTNPTGSWIKYFIAPNGTDIEFNDPGGACYSWVVRDSNNNVQNYSLGYPNFVPPYCN